MEVYRFNANGSVYCVVDGIDSLVRVREDEGKYEIDFSSMDILNLGYSFDKIVPSGSLADFVNDPLFELEVLRKWNQ